MKLLLCLILFLPPNRPIGDCLFRAFSAGLQYRGDVKPDLSFLPKEDADLSDAKLAAKIFHLKYIEHPKHFNERVPVLVIYETGIYDINLHIMLKHAVFASDIQPSEKYPIDAIIIGRDKKH